MVNIFCTKKLESFVTTEERTLESYASENNWNGQLISIGGRKCLYFLHRRTLYSVLLLNILKKDLLHLDRLFFEGIVNQMKIDKLYNPKLDNYLKENYSNITLFNTDNELSSFATLREKITHINLRIKNTPDKMIAATKYLGTSLNCSPMKSREFLFAKEVMEFELVNYLL